MLSLVSFFADCFTQDFNATGTMSSSNTMCCVEEIAGTLAGTEIHHRSVMFLIYS